MNDIINNITDDMLNKINDTNDTKNKNIQTKTKRKSKGIIGRSSNKDIKQRRKICKDIIQKSPVITKTKFIRKYKAECEKAKIQIPTQQTILNDARICKIVFNKKGDSKTSPIYSAFNRIGYDIGYYFSQIRVLCGSYDIIVFDTKKDKIDNIEKTLPLKKFLSRINPLDVIESDNYNDTRQINDTALTKIIIIFSKKGLENYIETVFEEEFRIKKSYLYTATSSYCFKVIFEFQDLKLMLKKIYEMLEFTQPSFFSEP